MTILRAERHRAASQNGGRADRERRRRTDEQFGVPRSPHLGGPPHRHDLVKAGFEAVHLPIARNKGARIARHFKNLISVEQELPSRLSPPARLCKSARRR
jgi:hypothetical protein